jgi:hypothetical protein
VPEELLPVPLPAVDDPDEVVEVAVDALLVEEDEEFPPWW